jgi:hypothetical protein
VRSYSGVAAQTSHYRAPPLGFISNVQFVDKSLGAMTYLNPLIAPIVQGPQAQRAAAADKERQIARAQALGKNSAAEGDRFEHAVESADALTPIGDHPPQGGNPQSQQRKPSEGSDEKGGDAAGEAHLDVTA